eukprot:TRINITY_DN6710_c0_g1_i2.p1 TRINITY_DN6710_c0_g1~~TRINITY_DN6710_c0_g1_i2.p1  ORF type:complete len:509 (+),score=101.04 TRINITY_DN6710_c0_g1_i2:135-1529(+)
MCPSTRKWNISITEANKEAQLVLLEAAKARQAMKPRDLEISVDFECCKFMGSKKGQKRPQTVKQHDCAWLKQKVLTDWRENITELKLGILGNEEFLKVMVFPKLQSLEFRMYDRRITGFNMRIMECVIFFNAATLKKLSLQNISSRDVIFQPNIPKLVLTTLILKKWQMGTLDSFIDACSDTLEVIDISHCESWNPITLAQLKDHFKKKLPKLRHLRLRHCRDEFRAVMYAMSPAELVTLRLVDNSFDYYGAMLKWTLPKVKFLWIESQMMCRFMAGFQLESLEVLVAVKIMYNVPMFQKICNKEDPEDLFENLKFPKLKELMVEGNDVWCRQLIQQNAESLERLTILRPTEGCDKLIELDCHFPNMKMMALRFSGEPVQTLVSSMKAKCPATTTIHTDRIKILGETKKHAEGYPYPMPGVVEDFATLIRDMNQKNSAGRDYGDGLDFGTLLGLLKFPGGQPDC